MIKKAQLKFVCMVMAILLGVFSVIFASIYYISYNQNLNTIERHIDETAKSFFLPDGRAPHANCIIATLKINPANQCEIIDTWIDEQTFSDEFATKITTRALSGRHSSGIVGNVYYKIIIEGVPSPIFIAMNCTDAMLVFRTNTTNTFFVLLIIYALLLLLVMKLSWWALKPLRESFEKQKQFVSNASHELKTPISIISANADVLQQEDNNQWINNIKSQTERMSVLVEDMLSLAKIDEGNLKLNFEKFDLSSEVTENALSFDAVAYEKGKTLTLNVQPDIIYSGDRQSVKKIVNILLDNAVKHASEKGEIIIELKKENNKTILSVFNTGSNVESENANKIFERFYRGDNSRSRESGGSGLGLSIAKSIADANKWKITAKSTPNVSMTITVIM